jgi:hypothetical protein
MADTVSTADDYMNFFRDPKLTGSDYKNMMDAQKTLKAIAADPDMQAMRAVRKRLEDGPTHFERLVKELPDHDRGRIRHAVDTLFVAKRIRQCDGDAPLGHSSFELVPVWKPKYP